MKKFNLFIFILIISCSQQTAPPLNLEDDQKPISESQNQRATLPEPPEATFASNEEEVEEPVLVDEVESGPSPDDVEDVKEVDPSDELKLSSNLYQDFAWEKYMVEPGDFLVKIAKREYGDFKLWKYIYEWNKEQIGDNPNIIYPYNFFNLQKERLKAKTFEPTYLDYVVQPGDNLWSIAGKQYGDSKSWIILLWDNEDSIKSTSGILSPGTVLRLREKLDPNS
jgi:nucleoid-associated protein YgaU